MAQSIVQYFTEWGFWAIPASLLTNGMINMVGFIPSVFVTTANVLMCGPWLEGVLSWLGEVMGSIGAFLLYRKGIHMAKIQSPLKWKWVQSLNQLASLQQLFALTTIRMTPFVPSGVILIVGSLTTVSFSIFLLSTMIGKVPFIVLEVWISYGFIHIKKYYIQLSLTLLILVLVYGVLKKRRTVSKG